MRATRLLLLGVIAGCSSQAYLEVRITAPDGTETVEVFLAPKPCKPDEQTCDTGVSWDQTTDRVTGEIYMLDSDERVFAERQDDGTFRIELREGPAGYKLSRLLLLGSSSTTTGHSAALFSYVDIPTDSAQRWQVTLQPIDDIPAGLPTQGSASTKNRLRVWSSRTDAEARCVAYEYADPAGAFYEFLLPPGDTDCDARVDCTDRSFWWDAPASAPDVAQASCTTKTVSLIDPSLVTCQIGGPQCSETSTGTASECVPVAPTHCATTGMCRTDCQTPTQLAACIESGQLGYLKCTIPTNEVGTPCVDSMNDTATTSFSGLVFDTQSTCGVPTFAGLSAPLMLGTPSLIGSVGLAATVAADDCSFALTWTGTRTVDQEYGYMVMPFSNGTSSVLGVKLDMLDQGTCEALAMSCTLYIGDLDDALACPRLSL